MDPFKAAKKTVPTEQAKKARRDQLEAKVGGYNVKQIGNVNKWLKNVDGRNQRGQPKKCKGWAQPTHPKFRNICLTCPKTLQWIFWKWYQD